jgi:hypothetical protein
MAALPSLSASVRATRCNLTKGFGDLCDGVYGQYRRTGGSPWWTGSPVPHSRSGWQWQIGWSSPEVRDYNGNVQKVEITAEVVSCLISEQFPQWAELEVRPVELDG